MTTPIFIRSYCIFCTLFFGFGGVCGAIFHKKCTEPVEALLIGSKKYKWRYTPFVRYTYQGIQYEVYTFDSLSKRKMRPLHQKRTFTVYVDPKKPQRSTITRKLSSVFSLIVITLLSLMMALIPFK